MKRELERSHLVNYDLVYVDCVYPKALFQFIFSRTLAHMRVSAF